MKMHPPNARIPTTQATVSSFFENMQGFYALKCAHHHRLFAIEMEG